MCGPCFRDNRHTSVAVDGSGEMKVSFYWLHWLLDIHPFCTVHSLTLQVANQMGWILELVHTREVLHQWAASCPTYLFLITLVWGMVFFHLITLVLTFIIYISVRSIACSHLSNTHYVLTDSFSIFASSAPLCPRKPCASRDLDSISAFFRQLWDS